MRFRRRRGALPNSARAKLLSLNEVRKVIGAAIEPAHFFIARPLILEGQHCPSDRGERRAQSAPRSALCAPRSALEWQHCPSEEVAWEIHQGRLLDPAHTRLRQRFESWNVFDIRSGNRSAEPILSLKLDAGSRQLHVTRAVHCYAWEGYHAGDNIYLSRETRKWVRELVGTIHLDGFQDAQELRDEIICLLFQAVVGCSRLPLQSVEAPLPDFSLGSLAYLYRPKTKSQRQRDGPMHS